MVPIDASSFADFEISEFEIYSTVLNPFNPVAICDHIIVLNGSDPDQSDYIGQNIIKLWQNMYKSIFSPKSVGYFHLYYLNCLPIYPQVHGTQSFSLLQIYTRRYVRTASIYCIVIIRYLTDSLPLRNTSPIKTLKSDKISILALLAPPKIFFLPDRTFYLPPTIRQRDYTSILLHVRSRKKVSFLTSTNPH